MLLTDITATIAIAVPGIITLIIIMSVLIIIIIQVIGDLTTFFTTFMIVHLVAHRELLSWYSRAYKQLLYNLFIVIVTLQYKH